LLPELILRSLRYQLGNDNWDIAPPLHRGLSGLPLYRVESKQGVFALRTWPVTAASAQKISLWGAVCERFQQLGEESDSPIPRPIPWSVPTMSLRSASTPYVIETLEWYWTLTRWVPGTPLSLSQVDEAVRLSLIKLLVDLHAKCRVVEYTEARSSGMKERVNALQDRDWDLRMRSSPHNYAIRYASVARIALQSTNQWLGWLQAWSNRTMEQHWIVRDLWRENVLISSRLDRMWIVDLGASRVESPLFDFVRLIGSLHPTKDEWVLCAEKYMELSGGRLPLSVDDLWRLHGISVALSIRYWNRALVDLSGRSEDWIAKAWERLGELLASWERCGGEV
jgi:hypothetical protein